MIALLIVSSLALFLPQNSVPEEKASIEAVTYTNSNVAALWIRGNGSDPGFPFDGEDVAPSYGMNYFSTNVIQVSWQYNWTDINNSALFPADCEIYRQIACTYAEAYSVANHSIWDSRIKGAWIDDFPVSLQTTANMSAIHGVLNAAGLTLGIVVYNRNYYDQSPNTWDDISAYFDIVHYWFYPNTYGLLYPQFAGYEDDFETFRSWLPSTMEYWLGIYLHYYNAGAFPLDFTYEQMSIAGKLMKLGHASKLSILENFWIQHNPETASLVRDFINDEYQENFSSIWYYDSDTVLSFNDGVQTLPLYINDIQDYAISSPYDGTNWSFQTGYLFESSKLQNLTIYGLGAYETLLTMPDFAVIDYVNGKHQYPYYDSDNERLSYILEPDRKYRFTYFKLTDLYINSTYDVNVPTYWYQKRVIINADININSTLRIMLSVVQFGNDQYNNNMVNFTKPSFGISIYPVDAAILYIANSVIEPANRAFPYFFERIDNAYLGSGGTNNFVIVYSVIACHTNITRPTGWVLIHDSSFFQVQPIGATYNYLFSAQATNGMLTRLIIYNTVFFNYDVGGSVGMFLLAYNLHTSDSKIFTFYNNTFIGGRYGLWVDMHYTDTPLTIEDHHAHNNAYTDLFVAVRLDGESSKELIVETTTIFEWSVKAAITGPTLRMFYTSIDNGLYYLTIDDVTTTEAVYTNTFILAYSGPWLPYRNNFTLLLFSGVLDTEENITNIIWVLIIFMIPIAICQTAPKIGFVIGMPLALLLFIGTNPDFFPYAIMGFISVVVYLYRGD